VLSTFQYLAVASLDVRNIICRGFYNNKIGLIKKTRVARYMVHEVVGSSRCLKINFIKMNLPQPISSYHQNHHSQSPMLLKYVQTTILSPQCFSNTCKTEIMYTRNLALIVDYDALCSGLAHCPASTPSPASIFEDLFQARRPSLYFATALTKRLNLAQQIE
jgi:hypothetical protein